MGYVGSKLRVFLRPRIGGVTGTLGARWRSGSLIEVWFQRQGIGLVNPWHRGHPAQPGLLVSVDLSWYFKRVLACCEGRFDKLILCTKL